MTEENYQLDKFFIFNRKFEGKSEELDYLKLLYFYPSEVPFNDQMMQIGIAEALTGFTTTFGNDMICDSLFTDQSKYVFIEPEPGYWMGCCVKSLSSIHLAQQQNNNNGIFFGGNAGNSGNAGSILSEQPIQDFSVYSDHYNLPYLLIKSKLWSSYFTFKTFHGKFEDVFQKAILNNYCNTNENQHTLQNSTLQQNNNLQNNNLQEDKENKSELQLKGLINYNENALNGLRYQLSFFFDIYWKNHLQFQSFNIFNLLNGLQFLPIQTNSFLIIQTFMNRLFQFTLQNWTLNLINNTLQSTVVNNTTTLQQPKIIGGLFFYENYLIFNGNVTHEDCKIISDHLFLLLDDKLKKVNVTQQLTLQQGLINSYGTYLTGLIEENKFIAPKVYINNRECQVVVFKYQKIVLFLIVDHYNQQQSNLDNNKGNSSCEDVVIYNYYSKLREWMNGELNGLNKHVSEAINRITNFDDAYKYIYFNQMNLAIKSSILTNSLTNTMKEALQMVCHLHTQIKQSKDGLKDVIVRNRKDSWIVGKYFAEREFFIIFDQKNYSLLEVHEQTQRITKLFFATSSKQ
ncbi:hypothetical protein ABK040_014802 [Willaertia magna]